MDPVLNDINKLNKRSVYYLHYSNLFRSIRYAVEKYAEGKVLDIGCGNKPYKAFFNEKVTEYIGCDLAQTELKTVDLICNATTIPLPGESVDTIFCTQVMEHIFDHKGLLTEANRLLKKGGIIILSVPLYWPEHAVPFDFFRFTKYGMSELLKICNFTTREIIENGGSWATSGQALVHSFQLSKRRSLFFRGIRFIFFKLRFIWIVNFIFKWLDKKDPLPINTMNYVIVAEKK